MHNSFRDKLRKPTENADVCRKNTTMSLMKIVLYVSNVMWINNIFYNLELLHNNNISDYHYKVVFVKKRWFKSY